MRAREEHEDASLASGEDVTEKRRFVACRLSLKYADQPCATHFNARARWQQSGIRVGSAGHGTCWAEPA